jgi:hypothetical protein
MGMTRSDCRSCGGTGWVRAGGGCSDLRAQCPRCQGSGWEPPLTKNEFLAALSERERQLPGVSDLIDRLFPPEQERKK